MVAQLCFNFSMAMNILYANTLTSYTDSCLTGFGVMIELNGLGGGGGVLPVYRNSHVRRAVIIIGITWMFQMSQRYITWNCSVCMLDCSG